MRRFVLLVLAACGGATASISASSSVKVTSSVDESPNQPPPADVDQHLHETPSYVTDVDKIYVEITTDDEHGDLLRQSATAGLTSTAYAVAVSDGGDLELHIEVASLSSAAERTSCKIKIFVLRMPQHDLLAIADGGAQASGHNSTDTCLAATSTAIVRDKLPLLLRRQLQAKQ